jgi:formylglycine-generating enzyme required for sulfatase activity
MRIPDLAVIPRGEFVMGKDGSRTDEAPAHRVRLQGFRAALRPVSNRDYSEFVSSTGGPPAPFVEDARFANSEAPVVGINWHQAVAYCDWLTARTGILFRLPTEAEREFASLGGLRDGDWPWPGENADFVRWVNALDGPHVPSPACQNGFGLYCMAENVHEWCSDWYSSTYYRESPEADPPGPATGTRRASRGGSWRHKEKTTRINARSSLVPEFQYSDFGFRVYAEA